MTERCATSGCFHGDLTYFESGGVGSWHCPKCYAKILRLQIQDLRASLSAAEERVAELEDTIDLREAEDDIARSFGRNTEAAAIEREIAARRGVEWEGARTSRQQARAHAALKVGAEKR